MKVFDLYNNSLTHKISKWLGMVYSDSRLAQFAAKCEVIYRHSMLHRIFTVHKAKRPHYTESVTFNILKQIGGWVNSIAGKFHDYFAKFFRMSLIGKAGEVLRGELRSCGLVLAFITIGYAVGLTTLAKWSIYSMVLVIILAFTSVIIFFTVEKWRSWFESSLFSKLVYFFFEK